MGVDARRSRARSALEGLSVGDAIGQQFSGSHRRGDAERRLLPPSPWRWTDDTNMAAAVFAWVTTADGFVQDELAGSLAATYDVSRAHGPNMQRFFRALRAGEPWRELAARQFEGRGSYGNGAAMRVAPLGAYFAEDLDAAADHARRSAEVTHAHPEAIAGAMAVALAAAVAVRSGSRQPLGAADFLDAVAAATPASLVRDGITAARTLGPDASVDRAVRTLGNGARVSAQDTVPFTLWVAARHLDDYEQGIWDVIEAGGDVDTTSAIVGGILAARLGVEAIPSAWIQAREPLPDWVAASSSG